MQKSKDFGHRITRKGIRFLLVSISVFFRVLLWLCFFWFRLRLMELECQIYESGLS